MRAHEWRFPEKYPAFLGVSVTDCVACIPPLVLQVKQSIAHHLPWSSVVALLEDSEPEVRVSGCCSTVRHCSTACDPIDRMAV